MNLNYSRKQNMQTHTMYNPDVYFQADVNYINCKIKTNEHRFFFSPKKITKDQKA